MDDLMTLLALAEDPLLQPEIPRLLGCDIDADENYGIPTRHRVADLFSVNHEFFHSCA
jgi:hypothetical protein